MLSKSSAPSGFVLLAILGCAEDRGFDPSPARPAVSQAQAGRLQGRLLLPGEGGRRGVELHAWVTGRSDGEEHQLWILPDSDGRFEREFMGTLARVSVSAGLEVHQVDAADLPQPDAKGGVDLGEIDLRELLTPRRVRVVEGDADAAAGVVRLGLWIGPPPTGPLGESPSLGSRQFRTHAIGSEVERLLPPEANDLYFLVERPAGPDHATLWQSGRQQLFGPYGPSAFPLELKLQD